MFKGMNRHVLRGTAGMDQATMAGLRERVYSGRPSYAIRLMNHARSYPIFFYNLWNSLKDNKMQQK